MIRKKADGIKLQNIERLRRCNNTKIALALFLNYIISLLGLVLSILLRHITADLLGRCIEGLIIRIHTHLRQNGGNRSGIPAGEKLCLQSILNVISGIALAHGTADAHGSRRIINVNTMQLRHCLVNHGNLRPVAVGDGELASGVHQICQILRRVVNGIPLLRCCVAKCAVTEGDNDSLCILHTYLPKAGADRL